MILDFLIVLFSSLLLILTEACTDAAFQSPLLVHSSSSTNSSSNKKKSCSIFCHFDKVSFLTSTSTAPCYTPFRYSKMISPLSVRSSSSYTTSSLSSSLNSLLAEQSTTLIAAESNEWRQYVPLVVSFGVILDILLGSPLANLALGPMRRAAAAGGSANNGRNDNDEEGISNNLLQVAPRFTKNPKERVDSDAFAQAALEKARYSMELRRYLEANKTNEQRYDEMREKIEKQTQELEDNLENIFRNKK